MENYFERTIGLIGEENFKKIQNLRIAIFGLGGVGGTAFESLLRTGFKKFLLVDFDCVNESNLNRQILFNKNDVGQNKIDAAICRANSICSGIDILFENKKAQNVDLLKYKIDFIVDAIDDTEGKLFLAKFAQENSIPLISSMGMANRFDPSKVYITKLNKTENDPLAKKIRALFRNNNIELNNIFVVCSKEQPKKFDGNLNSIICVPSSAGLNIAYFVLNYFLGGN